MFRLLFCVVLFVTSVFGIPNPEIKEIVSNTIEEPKPAVSSARAIAKVCLNGFLSPACLKIEAVALLEKLSTKEELPILPGISVIREARNDNVKSEEFAAELARSLPSKPEERLDKYLLYRLGNYLDTHSIKVRLMDDSVTGEARALVDEARGKNPLGGKKGGLGGLMAAALMMKGMLVGGTQVKKKVISEMLKRHVLINLKSK